MEQLMVRFIRESYRSESGVTSIEYGLLAALIAVAIIGGATMVGNSISNVFGDVTSELIQEPSTDGPAPEVPRTGPGGPTRPGGDRGNRI